MTVRLRRGKRACHDDGGQDKGEENFHAITPSVNGRWPLKDATREFIDCRSRMRVPTRTCPLVSARQSEVLVAGRDRRGGGLAQGRARGTAAGAVVPPCRQDAAGDTAEQA